MTSTTLGLDLGGTKIAAAVVSRGEILSRTQLPTPRTGYEAVLGALETAARELLAEHPEVERVGLGSPGPLDIAAGRVIFAPNIPGMEQAPVARDLSARLGLPVVLENDANAAGYAEHLYGAAQALESSIYVTISTGIGGGVFVGERVIRGVHGVAGEVGHMTLLPGGPLCGCGQHGCWEALAAGRAVARDASHAYGFALTTAQVFDRARAGERLALRVVENAAYYTGLALANLLKAFEPDGFVIGGGMAQAGAFYLDKVQAAADRFTEGFPSVKLFPAALGTDAGVIGAASVAAQQLSQSTPLAPL
ncbi:ROK family protein [Truepera radiovictrix]|uniref:ROK family protein n=1 Tax=Truepera radiovictrix (strain DSM 17093 / CIP 108686 / LMG 22925 / RQ-24) TaxID=649638 RepID=D7CXJ4_TRURR|nr:ROK family protein [Truepera radiovictrix]ADI14596.1 ROK family protein [Truepera radiovictrix DSM 17093]WMT56854.1 ROK family protein [Truepera radiovictrix]